MRKIQIKCVLDDTLVLGLGGVRENAGHDDSLPYQADVYVAYFGLSSKEPDYHKVGAIYNSGYGGPSELCANYSEGQGIANAAVLKRANELCQKHSILYKGDNLGAYDVCHLCDCMAEEYLYSAPKAKKLDLLYKFDDDPVVIAHPKKHNIFVIKHK